MKLPLQFKINELGFIPTIELSKYSDIPGAHDVLHEMNSFLDFAEKYLGHDDFNALFPRQQIYIGPRYNAIVAAHPNLLAVWRLTR